MGAIEIQKIDNLTERFTEHREETREALTEMRTDMKDGFKKTGEEVDCVKKKQIDQGTRLTRLEVKAALYGAFTAAAITGLFKLLDLFGVGS